MKLLKEEYIQHLKLRNLTLGSVRQIDQSLRYFIAYAHGRGVKDVAEVSATLFEEYKAYLSQYVTRKGNRLTSNTIKGRMQTIQRWFEFMRRRGAIFSNPIAGVKVPRREKRLPRGILRQDEIRKVMEQPDLRSLLGYRDRTMMEILYSTGVRANELVNLKLSDVDLEKKIARVRNGKGGRDRFVPLSTPCCRFLERYTLEIRKELIEGVRPAGNNWKKKSETGGDLLFLSIYGGAITKNWLGAMMKRYLQNAGITRPASPVHSFRHSVATHLLESGMDIRYVQVFLGHNDINSTQIYTHVERKSLQKMLKEYHPREIAKEFEPFREAIPKGNRESYAKVA